MAQPINTDFGASTFQSLLSLISVAYVTTTGKQSENVNFLEG